MQVVIRCPFCEHTVAEGASRCAHCNAKLTKAKFKFLSVLCVGLIAIAVAFVISFIIVPITIVVMIISFFAREKLHKVSLENPDDNPPSSPKGRVVDVL